MRFPITMALILCASLARAETAFPDGVYGDGEGCLYAKTGESSGADTFFLLNEEGVTTAASSCSIKKAEKQADASVAVTLSCEDEGGEAADETVTAVKSDDAYTLRFADGTTWGPLARCR